MLEVLKIRSGVLLSVVSVSRSDKSEGCLATLPASVRVEGHTHDFVILLEEGVAIQRVSVVE